MQRLSTLLSLIRSKMFEMERRPNDMLEENLQALLELEAVTNMKIGVLYMKSGRQELSERYLKKGVETATKWIGEFQPVSGEIYCQLREFYIKFEDYEKGVFNGKKSLAIRLNILGEYNIETGESYKGLGVAQMKNKEYEMALKNFGEALRIVEAVYS